MCVYIKYVTFLKLKNNRKKIHAIWFKIVTLKKLNMLMFRFQFQNFI